MTAALWDLRAAQLHLSETDLDSMTMGMFTDMYTERANDDCDYAVVATEEDFRNFFR